MDKLAKLSAFHAGDASSNLAGSTTGERTHPLLFGTTINSYINVDNGKKVYQSWERLRVVHILPN